MDGAYYDPQGAVAVVPSDRRTISPQVSVVTVTVVSPGASGTIDSAQIGTGKIGELMGLLVTSSVPFKAVLRTVLNAVASGDKAVGFSGADRKWEFIPPSRKFYRQAHDAGAGFDGFRVVVTNLDTGPNSADFYATFLYDEVSA